ncbi:MAG TPA: PH domain-containing protein [Coriobacteriia bacterium]|nr:PH domain-containing protein [Coriobacteriia bacterium]
MSDPEIRWFRSKVDWWLGLILVALPLVEVWALLAALRSGEREAVTATAAGCALVAAIYGLLLIPIRYGVSNERLIIRFGVVRHRIALDAISEVYATRNPLSSPALSLDRLAVRTGDGLLGMSLVSPVEREEFLSTLATQARLVRDGDRLIRPRDASG